MGSPKFDIVELESVTIYEDGYSKESEIIKYFSCLIVKGIFGNTLSHYPCSARRDFYSLQLDLTVFQ